MSESVMNVDREVERVLSKFGQLSEHASKTLDGLINSLQNLQRDLVVLSSNI